MTVIDRVHPRWMHSLHINISNQWRMMKRILLTALLMPLVCLAVWSNLDTAESDTYCGSHTDIEVDSSDKADIVYVKCDGDL